MAKSRKGKDVVDMSLPESEKARAVDMAVSQIERQFGKGAIMKLGSGGVIPDILTIPSGSLGLDISLGVGGIPRGRITEVFGPESSGKTTLCLHVIAEAQKTGGFAAFVDAEHALDVHYAKRLGVKTDELLISQPDTGEQALEITEILVRSGAMDVVVIDSVAALVPKAEIEGEMGDSHMGLQARLMSQALRKLTAAIAAVEHRGSIYQSDETEDRDHVRKSGNYHWWQCSQILRVGEAGYPPDCADQRGREYHRLAALG